MPFCFLTECGVAEVARGGLRRIDRDLWFVGGGGGGWGGE